MAGGIVGHLQIVQIEQEHSQRQVFPAQVFLCRRQTPPVQQPGQVIPAGLILQSVLMAAQSGHLYQIVHPAAQVTDGMAFAQKVVGVHRKRQVVPHIALGNGGQHRNLPVGRILPHHLEHLQCPVAGQRHAQHHHAGLPVQLLHGGGSVLRLQHLIAGLQAVPHGGTVSVVLLRHQHDGGRPPPLRADAGLLLRGRGQRLQQRGKLGIRHRLGEKVALGVIAAHRPQTVDLFPRFGALGHHAELFPVGQLHDMAQNTLGLRLGGLVAHKLHVQLENVQRHLGEHVQAGIAAAEVIHLDHEPFFPQGCHRADELLRMLRVGALCDFQM